MQIFHINNLISNFNFKLIQNTSENFIIFCDDNVKERYGVKLLENFKKNILNTKLLSFKAGEEYKTRATKENLEDQLLKLNIGKNCTFIALGGGVTSDLVGFLAATFLRGVKLIYIPTTLLSMVDASIGGKVGVNTPFGKNLIGAFYSPEKVLIDPLFLKTLPENELLNGYAEMLKHGLINSHHHFQKVNLSFSEKKIPDIDLILESIEIKQKIIALDYKDNNVRKILNFGHTFGHAIEKLSNFSIPHGRAVAIGMLMESYLSMKINLLNFDDFIAISKVLKCFYLREKFSFEEWINVLKYDKKNVKKKIEFIALQSIGKTAMRTNQITYSLTNNLIKDAIDWIHKDHT